MGFKKFQLDARLMANIERAGYSVPTPVQAEAIPVLMAGHDVVGTAQTGTGKTAAFVLPILHKMLAEAEKPQEAARAHGNVEA
ncbi:MAG: DEAD/DEAH box helicase, partial [Candidatus Sumerlaeota bacterium]|nr:DEAD/DEAH box helicase [Candidatus Sumerlaeota bacterium]